MLPKRKKREIPTEGDWKFHPLIPDPLQGREQGLGAALAGISSTPGFGRSPLDLETWKPLIPRQEQQENHRDGAKIPGLIPAPGSPEELPGAVGYFRGHAFIPLYFYPHVTHTARGMTHPRRIQSPELKPRSSAHIPGARGGIRRRMEKTWEEDPAPHPWSGVGTSSRPFSVQNPAR